MVDDRRNFSRRATDTTVSIATMQGQDLDPRARVANLSVGGIRIASSADLRPGERYRARLSKTKTWFEIAVEERIGGDYRCRIESPWEELYEVIRQSDDLTLLVLESSHTDGKMP